MTGAPPESGAIRNPTWSPMSNRSTTGPANHAALSVRIGRPCGPECQLHRANLSTSSPVCAPNRRPMSWRSRTRTWTARCCAVAATSNVWLCFDSHARKRGGWMLIWDANPTKQPAR